MKINYKTMKKLLFTSLLSLLVLAGCAAQDANNNINLDTEETLNIQVEDNTIQLFGQKPGRNISIALVELIKSGYVVIYEPDAQGLPGEIIGNSDLLAKGKTEEFNVSLIREVKEGEELFAVMHLDNGDSKFEAENDEIVKSKGGKFVAMSFTVNEEME